MARKSSQKGMQKEYPAMVARKEIQKECSESFGGKGWPKEIDRKDSPKGLPKRNVGRLVPDEGQKG